MITDKHKMNACGVSEAIGFLLIFSIVIAGIGLVTLYGYPLLMKQQTSADEQIMEKNMIVLQNDVKSLAYKTVPYKETSLKVGSGTLSVHHALGPTLSTFRISDGVGPDIEFHPGELRYESLGAQTDISLQNGAVIKRARVGEGSVMLAEPRWFYDDTTKTLVINLISLNSTGTLAKTGIGTVQMKLGETSYQSQSDAGGLTVTLDYTPDALQDTSTAWKTYLTRNGWTETGANTYRFTDSVNTLVVKQYDVIVQSI
jgi:hypothetical protein